MVGVENTGCIALGFGNRAGVVKQLTQLIDRITYVGTQHVFTKKLMKHLPHGAFQKRHPARVPRAVPGVRAIGCILQQFAEKRWRQPVEVRTGFPDNMAGHELGRIFKHMNEAMQLTQNIIRDMPRRARFPIKINRDIFIAEPQLTNE